MTSDNKRGKNQPFKLLFIGNQSKRKGQEYIRLFEQILMAARSI